MFMKFKMVVGALLAMGFLAGVANAVEIPSTGTKVGGHLKLYAFDAMIGTWTDTNGVEQKGHQNAGFNLARASLIISQEITDFISVELMPNFSASAGATPRLGRKIDTMTPPASRSITFSGWQKAYAKFMLPKGYEISVGIITPRLSYEYSTEIWWDEEFHVNKAAHDFGVLEDNGIEIYKDFELEKLSLPVYLYLLNGSSQIGENNKTPLGLFHIEPEFGPVRLLGSFSYTKYDAHDSLNEIRWAAGATYTAGGFSIRSEVMGVNSQGKIRVGSTYRDASGTGFYIKPLYQYAKWGKLGVDFSYADEKTDAANDHDKDMTITPLLLFIPYPGVNIISQNDIGIWTRNNTRNQKLNFFRSTFGIRCTF